MVNDELVVDVPEPEDEGLGPDAAQQRVELLALLLLVVGVGAVLLTAFQALATTQQPEGVDGPSTSDVLLTAASGLQWGSVLPLAGALGLLLLVGDGRRGQLGRSVLAATVVVGGVLTVMGAYLFQQVVRTDDQRFSFTAGGGEAPGAQEVFARLSSGSYVASLTVAVAGIAYLAWQAGNEDRAEGPGAGDDGEHEDEGPTTHPAPLDDAAWGPDA